MPKNTFHVLNSEGRTDYYPVILSRTFGKSLSDAPRLSPPANITIPRNKPQQPCLWLPGNLHQAVTPLKQPEYALRHLRRHDFRHFLK